MISRIKSLLSSIQITRLDKRRAELAMAWAQRHPLASSVYNLGNYLFLGLIKAGSLVARPSTGSGTKTGPNAYAGGGTFPPVKLPGRPRVLLVVEDSIPQCFQYRVQQKLDMLDLLGWQARWLRWSDIDLIYQEIHFHDVVILYRVPGFPDVMSFISYAKVLNKLLIYDLDDLIFDRTQLERKFSGDQKQLTRKTYKDLLTGADLYKATVSAIPFCFVSTESLRDEVEKVGDTQGIVLPNGISCVLASLVDEPCSRRENAPTVDILYGSGTRTHDADFLYVSGILQQVLREYPKTRLIIVGPVNIDEGFNDFGPRVIQIEFLEYASYLEILARASINIAPLEPGIFGDCKSEIKWLEAGLLGVPSLVSKTRTYASVIDPGITGLLADSQDEWKSNLTALVSQPELRAKIGAAAKQHVSGAYGRKYLAELLASGVTRSSEIHTGGSTQPIPVPGRRRVLLVNTLYPPQAMGGATRIVKELVEGLQQGYNEEYEIQVFTCDVNSTQPYRLYQYLYEGITVTSLSVPMRPDFELQYNDHTVKEIFGKLLRYFQPDLVHFHSIQRLTAATLEAAEELSIPFVVTLHDSWWISDHPFMIDDNHRLLPPNISEPLVANEFSDDIDETLGRNRYLRNRLNHAKSLVAVSSYQAELYRQNSFPQVQIIENGVDRPSGYTRQSGDQLVLGYMGGKSAHKGYYFLKDNISTCELNNIRVKTIDLFSTSGDMIGEEWGKTPVDVHSRFELRDIGSFYSMIDVLVMPSLWPESFGLVAREASLLGIWVVLSSSGGLTEAVIQGETGHLFEPGNNDQFREILIDLDRNWQKYKQPTDPESIRKIRIQAVARNVQDTHDLYLSILGN